MTAKQKLVLLIFGVLDLAVIVGLGAVVIQSQLRDKTPVGALTPDPCTQAILAALDDAGEHAVVDWTEDSAHITLALESPVPGLPPEQHLWVVLDTLPAPLPPTCLTPEVVDISIRAPNGVVHTTQLDGHTLVAWLAGATSEADLADQARYRSLP